MEPDNIKWLSLKCYLLWLCIFWLKNGLILEGHKIVSKNTGNCSPLELLEGLSEKFRLIFVAINI